MASDAVLSSEPFPSLVIRADALEPHGAFAEAQARCLDLDPGIVAEVGSLLREKNVGVVAHFYMDPELQGVLSACDSPHIHVADSLEMASRAVDMARAGVDALVVLGVDFMSENVRAVVNAAGFEHVPVYRVRDQPVGCTLAESARTSSYAAFVDEASRTPRSLHVIYVNTGLDVKARGQARVPTITCTSSNVVQMVLQAAAQVDGLSVWYGPDSHMGANLRYLFTSLLDMDESAIRALHADHNRGSIAALVERLHYFEQGVCVVHHTFDDKVVEMLRRGYPDALIAAHLEVPREMFARALEAQRNGSGVVGSTANILQFIAGKVEDAAKKNTPRHLKFVLGTEPGMVTAIVRRVRSILNESRDRGTDQDVEIIFPISSDSGAPEDEGRSEAGGSAVCPYMKMNSLDALFDLLGQIGSVDPQALERFEPRKYSELINGRSTAELGGETILHMRAFQQSTSLPDALVEDIQTRRS